MATKKQASGAAAAVAVALCDIPGLGVRAGQIVEAASPQALAALLADGSVDVAAAAIDYARSQDAATVQLPDPLKDR